MKVIGVLGSPHVDGPSNTIAREVLRGAKDAGHEVVIFNLNAMNLRGCQACGYCKRHWCDCVIEDDLTPYWKHLHECGALVLSAPNYCSQVSGPMITFMNRHYCLMMNKDGEGVPRIHPGIKLIGLFSQGNPDPNAYLESAYKWYLGDFEARHMVTQDIIVHTGGMPVSGDSAIMRRAYEDGLRL